MYFERNLTDGTKKLTTLYARTQSVPTIKEVTEALALYVRQNPDTEIPDKGLIYVRVSHVQYGWNRSWSLTVHATEKGARSTNVAEFKGNRPAKKYPIPTEEIRGNDV